MSKKKRKIASGIIGDIFLIIIIVIASRLFTLYIAQQTLVDGRSMESTLHHGDRLITNKIGYRLEDPERFDVIVLSHPRREKIYYVKRIIGLPGESVRIDPEGNIYINDQILEENYGKERMYNPGIAIGTIQLGEDEYFVLGDNRNNSTDSRFEELGAVKKSQIVGKASFRIYPFDQIGGIE